MGIKALKLVVVCVAITVGFGGNITEFESSASRAKLLFNSFSLAPFTIVQILNVRCDTVNGQYGTCLAKMECLFQGGTQYGICGHGFGVCCVIQARENGVSFANNTLLYKDEFNSALDTTYTIRKMNDQICQFRLEVKSLVMEPPEWSGMCFYDYMKIDQDSKFDKVCGTTTNVHYYIDIKDTYTVFTFHTDANKSSKRKWEIYVSQHTCDQAAPNGCGQWYWGTSGTIGIWNNNRPVSTKWVYVSNQEYAICVRWEANYCTITYTESEPFFPECSDYFERPGRASVLQNTCTGGPPTFNALTTYTLSNGLQYFYVKFRDNSNVHASGTFEHKSFSATYTQNSC